ncbi:unnamed protein product [Coregonus sp. 'balchen']|nr:unnamed protein product [Coregonus sp. 'balchen']
MAMSNEIYANDEFDNDNDEAADRVENIYINEVTINSHDSRNKTKDIFPKCRPPATNPGTESSERRSTRAAPVPVTLSVGEKVRRLEGLIDSGAAASFLDMGLAEELGVQLIPIQPPLRVNALDAEQEQLQTKYNAMTKDRDQLRVERDDLQAKHSVVEQHVQQGYISKTKDVSPKNRPQATNSGSERRPIRAATVCLGLLCVLLLAGIYNGVMGSFEENILVYKTNYSAEQDQFQTRYSAMTQETDQLRVERDQFKTMYFTCVPCGSRLKKTHIYRFHGS